MNDQMVTENAQPVAPTEERKEGKSPSEGGIPEFLKRKHKGKAKQVM